MNKRCDIYKNCGGCTMQDMDYKKQLEYKTNVVKELFKQKNIDTKINDCIGMDNPYNYRNKAKYVFGYDKSNKPIMGFFKEGTHHIIACDNCIIQQEPTNEVAKYIIELVQKYKIAIYNEDSRKGFLRYVIIKYGVHTNELMIVFVTIDSKMHRKDEIIRNLTEKFPNIKTIVQNINEKENNAILGDKNYNLYGKGYIVDYIGEYKFKISPLSFFQVNTVQTEKLYNIAVKYMELTGHETVYDLYSGIGTISLYASKNSKKVYGIEMINDAVKDAIENAKLNKIENVQFLSGKVENVLPKLYKQGSSIDVVVVDPPRVGLDKKTIETIKEFSPNKFIYISCNPETLAENLIELLNEYEVKEVQPVDMFPFTAHVESVVKLVRRM
jgi:23S rRNA (uracil1939-C5)-methyltransferase